MGSPKRDSQFRFRQLTHVKSWLQTARSTTKKITKKIRSPPPTFGFPIFLTFQVDTVNLAAWHMPRANPPLPDIFQNLITICQLYAASIALFSYRHQEASEKAQSMTMFSGYIWLWLQPIVFWFPLNAYIWRARVRACESDIIRSIIYTKTLIMVLNYEKLNHFYYVSQ